MQEPDKRAGAEKENGSLQEEAAGLKEERGLAEGGVVEPFFAAAKRDGRHLVFSRKGPQLSPGDQKRGGSRVMEVSEANAALNQTVAQLQGGVLRLGIASAIPVISSWEQTLGATGIPELTPVAQNLTALRNLLAMGDFVPAEVGRLLNTLSEQVRAVAGTPYGLPIAVPLTQLSLFLNTAGGALAGQGAR